MGILDEVRVQVYFETFAWTRAIQYCIVHISRSPSSSAEVGDLLKTNLY